MDFIDNLIAVEKQKKRVEDIILNGSEKDLKREYKKYTELLKERKLNGKEEKAIN